MKSRLNWFNDPMMKRLLRLENEARTRAALKTLYEEGIIAICPDQRYKLTPAAKKEYNWFLL